MAGRNKLVIVDDDDQGRNGVAATGEESAAAGRAGRWSVEEAMGPRGMEGGRSHPPPCGDEVYRYRKQADRDPSYGCSKAPHMLSQAVTSAPSCCQCRGHGWSCPAGCWCLGWCCATTPRPSASSTSTPTSSTTSSPTPPRSPCMYHHHHHLSPPPRIMAQLFHRSPSPLTLSPSLIPCLSSCPPHQVPHADRHAGLRPAHLR